MDAPKIPTLKDSQKPQVKVRGLEAGVTLFDRLKQFKKKDLAFILAGLGTLFMAPLAEHFMMAPEQASDMTPGMGGGKGGGSGLFNGSGSGPYEPGNTGLAAGNPAGGSLSDIITPLNVRDPSALVMGPGATQQPPTQSAAPATPPPTAPVSRNDSDLKDALAASGARAAGAASKAAKALLPVPKVALGGSGLRGLGVSSGGSSASGGLAPISAANVSNKASTGGGLSPVKALPGYRGAASGRGQGQGGSGMEALKAAADKQGNVMNQGSASTALDQAAAQQIPGGGAGLGGGGQGGASGTDKSAGGNQDKSSKNVGESLEFLKQKAIQEKKIELWGKEQEAKDMSLLMNQVRNDAIKGIVGEMAKSLGACAGKLVTMQNCADPTLTPQKVKCLGGIYSPGQFAATTEICQKDGSKLFYNKALGEIYRCPGMASPAYDTGCSIQPGDSNTPASTPPGSGVTTTNPGGATLSGPAGSLVSAPASNLKGTCADLNRIKEGIIHPAGGMGNPSSPLIAPIDRVLGKAAQVVAMRDALANGNGGATGDASFTNDCNSSGVPGVKAPVARTQNDAINTLLAAVPDMRNAVKSSSMEKEEDPYKVAKKKTDDALSKIASAREALTAVDKYRATSALKAEDFTATAGEQKAIEQAYSQPGKAAKYAETDIGKDFKALADSFGAVEASYKTSAAVQDRLDKGGGLQPIFAVRGVNVIMGGGDVKGDQSVLPNVIPKNKDFSDLAKDLQDAAKYPKAAEAKFTLKNPDAGVIQNGEWSQKGDAVKAAGDKMTAVRDALKDYETAPDAPPATTKKDNIQNNLLDGESGVTKTYTAMWKDAGGSVKVLAGVLDDANKTLTQGVK